MALQWVRELLGNNTVFKLCALHAGVRTMYTIKENKCSNCKHTPQDAFCNIYYLHSRVAPNGEAVYTWKDTDKLCHKNAYFVPVCLCKNCYTAVDDLVEQDAAMSDYLLHFHALVYDVTSIISNYLYGANVKCPYH